MDNFVSFDGLGSTFLHNIYGSSKGRIRTDLIGEDLDFILELMKDRGPLCVLDLGCGTGFFSSRLAALGHHADLCDVSEEMIAEAEKFAAAQHTQQNMNFFCASAFELPCQITGRTYDLILCHAVMEWVEDQRKLLEIIKSRLSPGGELSLLVYNRQYVIIEAVDKTLHGLKLGTAVTEAEVLHFQQKHQLHNFLRHLVTDAAGVAHHQIALQLAELLFADADVAKAAEASRYAVDGLFLGFHLAVQVVAAFLYSALSLVAQGNCHILVNDFTDHCYGQRLFRCDIMSHLECISVVGNQFF